MDVDNNGVVSKYEFLHAFNTKLKFDISRQETDAVFKRLDLANSGKIQYKTFFSHLAADTSNRSVREREKHRERHREDSPISYRVIYSPHSLTYALTHSLTHSLLTQSQIHSLTHWFTHSLTHSITDSLTNSLTDPLTHTHSKQ